MTNYEHIKDLDEYEMTKFLVLFQTAQIMYFFLKEVKKNS